MINANPISVVNALPAASPWSVDWINNRYRLGHAPFISAGRSGGSRTRQPAVTDAQHEHCVHH
jgi:hypothetical protein